MRVEKKSDKSRESHAEVSEESPHGHVRVREIATLFSRIHDRHVSNADLSYQFAHLQREKLFYSYFLFYFIFIFPNDSEEEHDPKILLHFDLCIHLYLVKFVTRINVGCITIGFYSLRFTYKTSTILNSLPLFLWVEM